MSHLSIIFLMVNFLFLATLAVAIALQFMKNLECIIVEFIWIHILDKFSLDIMAFLETLLH